MDECGLLGSKPTEFSMEANHKLALSIGKTVMDPTQYRRLVGRLIYLIITGPELSYTIHILSQFMHEPKKEHLEAAKRVLSYLKGNLGQVILPKRDSNLCIYAYCGSNWGGGDVLLLSTLL